MTTAERACPAAPPQHIPAPSTRIQHRACCSRRRHCSLRSGYSRSLTASNLLLQQSRAAWPDPGGCGQRHQELPASSSTCAWPGGEKPPSHYRPGTPAPLSMLLLGPATQTFPPCPVQGTGPPASSWLPGLLGATVLCALGNPWLCHGSSWDVSSASHTYRQISSRGMSVLVPLSFSASVSLAAGPGLGRVRGLIQHS